MSEVVVTNPTLRSQGVVFSIFAFLVLALHFRAATDWSENGSPYGQQDSTFWTELEQLPGTFSLPFNPGSDPGLSFYGLSIVKSIDLPTPPKAFLYDGPKSTTSITVYVRMDYSDNNYLAPRPNPQVSGRMPPLLLDYDGGINSSGTTGTNQPLHIQA
ncbi:MAG: hypothetical protein U1G07_25925 [Verrucomicrobiota bacterium]